MERRASRVLAGVELVVLAIPLSIQAAVGGFNIASAWWTVEPGRVSASSWALAPVLAAHLAALAALWRVVGAFVVWGRRGLMDTHRVWWWLLAMGGGIWVAPWVIAMVAVPFIALHALNEFAGRIVFGLFAIGFFWPALILPLAHVAVERKLAQAL